MTFLISLLLMLSLANAQPTTLPTSATTQVQTQTIESIQVKNEVIPNMLTAAEDIKSHMQGIRASIEGNTKVLNVLKPDDPRRSSIINAQSRLQTELTDLERQLAELTAP